MKKIKNKIDNTPLLSIIGAMTLVVIAALCTFYVGAKTALALEPYVKGYDIALTEDYVVKQGDTLTEIAMENMVNYPSTGKENAVKCYRILIAQYNGIRPEDTIKWGETIKLPIVVGSEKANSITVG